jgi:hypothetical protein
MIERDTAYRKLPAMTEKEKQAVRLAQLARTACSNHLADLGLIQPKQIKANHEAIRRVARRAGIDTSRPWIGQIGKIILTDPPIT